LIKVINKIAESSHQFAFQNMSSIRTLVSELHAREWLAILLARLAVGLLFFLSGRGQVFVAERREQMRQTLLEAHVPFPKFNTIFVSIIELLFGVPLVTASCGTSPHLLVKWHRVDRLIIMIMR
jgi:hypothetical protein